MATTITLGAESVSPELVTGYVAARQGGNLLHKVIARADPDVTLSPAGLRSGTLEIWCADLDVALAADALHAGVGVLHLTDDALPGLDMDYVLAGRIETSPAKETTRWVVRVEYAEVLT